MRSGRPWGSSALLCVSLLRLATFAQGFRSRRQRLRAPASDRPGQRPLWTYWESPERPALVDLCVETLRYRAGPDWKVHVLSKDTALGHVEASDLPAAFSQMRASFQADALRLALLRRHGGMWIDATTIAARNFSDWVGQALDGGSRFYGFYIQHYTAPEGPPLVASWAAAVAEPEEPVVAAWHDAYKKVWRNRSSAEGIVSDPFFAGADISHVNPLLQDYLNVELVLLVLLQRDASLRQRFDSTAAVQSAESGPYAIQAQLGMGWMGGDRCRPVTARLAQLPAALRRLLASTPLVKLRHQDRRYLEQMSVAQLLGQKDSVLGSLLLANGASAEAAAPSLLDFDAQGAC